MKNENKAYKSTKMWLKKLHWLLLAVLIIYALGNCTTPKGVRSKIRSVGSAGKEQVLKNKESNNPPKIINNVVLDEQTELPNNNSPQISISPQNTTTPNNTQVRIPTIREQLNQLQIAQTQTNTKVTYIEEELDVIKKDIQEIKKAIVLLKGETVQDALAGVPPENYATIEKNNSEDTHQTNNDKSIVMPDNYTAPKNISKSSSNNTPKTNKKSGANNQNNITKPSNTPKTNNELNVNKRKEVPEKNSNNNDAQNINKALNNISNREYEEAIQELNNILNSEQDKEKIGLCNYWLGEAYFATGQYEKSIYHLQKVLTNPVAPKKAEAQALLAEAYIRFGQVTEAKKTYEELLEKYPKSQFSIRARKMLQQL